MKSNISVVVVVEHVVVKYVDVVYVVAKA